MKNKGAQFLAVIVLLQIVFLPILFFNQASAADFSPQVSIPGSEFKTGSDVQVSQSTATIAQYIKAIYQYGIGIVGILAAVVLMFGGLLWLTAGGDAGRVSEAKEWIKASLLGLVIALCSYVILLTINPDLVNFRAIEVAGIKPVEFNINKDTKSSSELSVVVQTCENNGDCPSGENCLSVNGKNFCSGGKFLHACRNNSDCKSSLTCINNECLGGEKCNSNSDCPEGWGCSSYYYDKLGYKVCLIL
ncbi:MAG: pilin [Patescibacteria group bacterium]|jgi:hypothetical protein